ncbi:ribosomal protein S18 [Trichodelitschia bisporula]|uniref:Small ribosomal subunit protein bS18m n=1 Tax=Trichodelitschia bisporula TaxID=703511 RepID=A0A6G1I2B0_9PEZI|nr:ribosomal protein S18 [Trichodelitschia bisporula]
MQCLRYCRPSDPSKFAQFARSFASAPAGGKGSGPAALIDLLKSTSEATQQPPSVMTAQEQVDPSLRTALGNSAGRFSWRRPKQSMQTTLQQLEAAELRKNLSTQMPRPWRAGDVYAPRDIGFKEARKWKKTQQTPKADVFDMLGQNPLNHYKNINLMSQFVSSTGRIKKASSTGLRPVNQRKMAKAVRRAIGIGLLPSVHLHPEILREKVGMPRRTHFATKGGSRGLR